MVNKARLIEKIAELVKDKKIDGITELSDQSSRDYLIHTVYDGLQPPPDAVNSDSAFPEGS